MLMDGETCRTTARGLLRVRVEQVEHVNAPSTRADGLHSRPGPVFGAPAFTSMNGSLPQGTSRTRAATYQCRGMNASPQSGFRPQCYRVAGM